MSISTSDDFVKNHLFLAGMALVVNCLMAMSFLGVAWFFGGEAFMDSLYGKQTLAVLAAAIAAGAVLAFACRGGRPIAA